MKTVLIIEDDSVIAEVQKDYLEASGFAVEVAATGDSGLQKAVAGDIDLILLDLMLPGVDGYEICKKVRQVTNIPILMVSAKKEEIDKIRGLGLGADDYISKPFSVGELVARVKAHISRFERLTMQANQHVPQPKDELKLNGLTIDKIARKVFVRDREVTLTTKEYDLLLYLASHPNRVFTKDELFERIWGYDAIGDNATVTVHISKIREKVEYAPSKPQMIETIWGVGYRFNV